MIDKYKLKRNTLLADKLIKNLEKRHFEAYYTETKEEALKKALELISHDDVISWGGSVSVAQTGLTDYVINNGYKVINRDKAKDAEEKHKLLHEALNCDVYLTGTNAISFNGELVNIDCIGNRAAALIYGPKKVIVIAGMNKVEPDLDSALKRAKNYAAPVNIQRVGANAPRKTPCYTEGRCFDCFSEDSICSNIVITRLCHPKGRIKIILTGEELGF